MCFLRPALRFIRLAHQRNVEIKKTEIYRPTSLPSKLEKSFGRGERRPLITVNISLLNMEMMRLRMNKTMMEGPITLQLTYCCLVPDEGGVYRRADKSLARPGRKQAQKHVRGAHDLNNIETQAVIKSFFFCKAGRQRKFTPF